MCFAHLCHVASVLSSPELVSDSSREVTCSAKVLEGCAISRICFIGLNSRGWRRAPQALNQLTFDGSEFLLRKVTFAMQFSDRRQHLPVGFGRIRIIGHVRYETSNQPDENDQPNEDNREHQPRIRLNRNCSQTPFRNDRYQHKQIPRSRLGLAAGRFEKMIRSCSGSVATEMPVGQNIPHRRTFRHRRVETAEPIENYAI